LRARIRTWRWGTYRLWTAQVARREKVVFLDLSRIIADRYQREGGEAVKAQFIDDTVHTNLPGAEANARDVVSGLRAAGKLPFRGMLSDAGRAVPADRGPSGAGVCPALPSD